jgi:tetratricopeptide (TPR) repeat protein
LRLAATFAMFSASVLAAGSHLENGIAFQKAGKLHEADRELRFAVAELQTAGSRPDLVKALSIESWISVSLGNYSGAIQLASQAVQLRHALHDEKHLADDLNTLALAYQNLGKYGLALDYFGQALRSDRAASDAEGEITRLNNIGAVYYFEGRYVDALNSYEQAKSKVDSTALEPWNPRRRQLTLANLAAVYQRLGKEETALDVYRQVTASPHAMPPRERAQLLLNQGALYRRLGDPVKALGLYRSAQDLYAVEHYSDGEIGALRNIGIARAIDLGDLNGALNAFDAALRLAQNSSNRRGIVQAVLYRGETLRRMHRWDESKADALFALEGAKSAGLTEEQWRALYLLGRIAETSTNPENARENYERAIALIESMRTGLQTPNLRNEFLADKRDVYDALIALRLADGAPVDELFRLIESSRSRALNESAAPGSFQDLRAIQSRLDANSTLLDLWTGNGVFAAVWVAHSQAGVMQHSGGIREPAAQLIDALQSGGDGWRELSRTLGATLLSGVPVTRHLIVVPDGPLSAIPFEGLAEPGSKALLIEQSDVSYLPSAQFLARAKPPARSLLPWQRQLVALGDPPAGNSGALDENWQSLPASAGEIRSIQRVLPGRSEAHLGADARKSYLAGSALENVPLLHFGTHAMVDAETPDRSRILLASGYLFQREVYSLDLRGVDLVTISACDTARGKIVRGEGMQAFSRAFLAAGARSTVASLWRVPDDASAAFMKQFYYFLAQGLAKSQALRSAKLELLRSRSVMAQPRYWAAFILTGDGATAVPLALPSSPALFAAAGIAAVIALLARWKITAVRSARRTEESSIAIHRR